MNDNDNDTLVRIESARQRIERWKHNRLRKELDVQPLNDALELLREYRTMVRAYPQLSAGMLERARERGFYD
jgi:hypothetical protein